jgi:hypothetical protein
MQPHSDFLQDTYISNKSAFRLWLSALWHHVILQAETDVSDAGASFIFNPADGGNMFLQNISICIQDYTMSQLQQPQSKQSPLWKPQNL